MINSNDKTRLSAARRVGWVAVRLFGLLALLLALSPSSKAYDSYINGLESNGVKMNGSDNDYTYTYTPTSNGTKYIYLWDGKAGKDIGPYTSNETISFSNNTYTYNECHENSNKWVFNVSTDYTYTFTYWNEYSGKHRLQITRTARQTQSSTPTVIGSWNGSSDWSTGKNMDAQSNGWYQYKIDATSYLIQFRVKNGNAQYYPGADDFTFTEKDSKQSTTTDGSANKCFQINTVPGRTYYIRYYPNDGNKVAAWWEEPSADTYLSVVPARVSNRHDDSQWATVTSSNPAVYLLSDILNGTRPSPEWEMISTDGGNTYTLEFTARETFMSVWTSSNEHWVNRPIRAAVYGGKNVEVKYSDEKDLNDIFDWDDHREYGGDWKGNLFPGRRYKATYTRSSNTLSLTALDSEKNYPPYISLVGYHFKQSEQYDTPTSGKKNTNGWQEAWIQFDANGDVQKDINNKVMYNTMWPPVNPVYFYVQPKTNGEYIELTSERLQMEPETNNGSKKIQTGAQWKAELGDIDEYKNLFNSTTYNKGVGAKQALRDDHQYIRYVAHDVWILGSTKVWTGWGGTYTENGKNEALWSNHANWGIGEEYDNEKGTGISPNEPWNLKGEAGNFAFEKPTFFKTVEVFYCVNRGKTGNNEQFYDMYDGCIFYTTQGFGTPHITAKSVNEFKYGDFETSVECPDGYTVQSYIITRYDATTDKPCNTDREPVSHANARVRSESGKNYTEEQFNNLYKYASTVDNAKEKTLADGKYYYELQVTFVDNNGQTKSEVVTSPIVTIFNPIMTTPLNNAQLVEVVDKNDAVIGSYDYITYGGTLSNVYGINVTGDEINATALEGDFDTYYGDGTKVKFTDKVFLSCRMPSKFSATSVNYPLTGIGNYTLRGAKSGSNFATAAGTKVAGGKQSNNYYREIRTMPNLNNAEYNVVLSYNYYVENTYIGPVDSEPEATTAFLTVPTPKLNDAKVEVYFGTNNGEGTDNNTNAVKDFTYKGKTQDFTLEKARYQNVRESVDIDMPNATADLQTKMKSTGDYLFTFYSIKDDDQSTKNSFELDENWNRKGNLVKPSALFNTEHPDATDENWNVRKIVMESSYANVYNRWGDGKITSIALTENAPVDNPETDNDFIARVEKEAALYYNTDGDLISQFTAYIQMEARQDNFINHDDKELNEKLLHGDTTTGHYDYYYVTIVDNSNLDENNEPQIAIVDDEATDAKDKYAEYVYTVENLNKTHDNGGMYIKFRKNYGQYYDGQLAQVMANPYYKNLELRVSYLYPFNTAAASSAPKRGIFRTAADLSGDVVKSRASVLAFDGGEVWTGVEGIDANSVSVNAGVGFIEVTGSDVEIFNAQGMKVAAGEGRHDLNSGVYVVRVSGQTHKVMVR